MPKYEVGKIVTCCVTGIEKYGVFVSLDDYYSGLIHISEISEGFVKNINDFVHIGETIKVKILEIDSNTFHLKLSIKGIDYRIQRKRRTKIKETEHGFSTLGDMLNIWVKEKTHELFQEEVK